MFAQKRCLNLAMIVLTTFDKCLCVYTICQPNQPAVSAGVFGVYLLPSSLLCVILFSLAMFGQA